ncbi:hypothetical protein D915_002761 [Fasciola hepatica]|uniref:Uncharacterized protein n=1 Tax=Fasciola hepatica TaxID=6192 RepID=A0A4E0RH12_FASHE|nr:hypothetical protein D915_002761 [Fasciola hepatica]
MSSSVEYMIPCQQVNDLVRIGPIDTTGQYTPMRNPDSIQLAPWAFDGLMWDRTVSRLQLDLQLRQHDVTALSLGGLDNLEELLARTSYIRWNACSLAGLTKVRQVLLSCRSEYDEFLTLGPSVDMIRFVDCDQTPIQFYCIGCIQDPSVHVIRVRPGPPLRQYMVKFTQISRTFNETRSSEQRDRLSLGRCVPNICSDSMLCRDDQALQMVQKNMNRPSAPETVSTQSTNTTFIITTTVESITEDIQDNDTKPILLPPKPAILLDEIGNISLVNIHGTTASIMQDQDHPSSTMTYSPTKSNADNVLTRSQRIWIAASILSVIAVFLITACVLIGILRQRSNRRRSVKFNRPRAHQTKYTNGVIHDRIAEDESGKLELPERVC